MFKMREKLLKDPSSKMISSSDSDPDTDRNVFLPEIDTKRSRRTRRFYPIVLIVLVTTIVALLIAVIVLASRKGVSAPGTAPSTDSPSTPTPSPTQTLAPTSPKRKEVWDNVRLPGDVIPRSYQIDISATNLDNGHVTGDVKIRCDVIKSTSTILIHALNMTISKSRVIDVNGGGADVAVSKAFVAKENQYWVMQLGKSVKANSLVDISLHWEARLASGLSGFYRSTYKDLQGKQHTIATTQMESTNARLAFPCFDEPAMKAKFNISILYDPSNGYSAISNMPIWWNQSVSVASQGFTRAHFEQTPRMSTYLVAFIISNFHFVQNATKSGTQVRVWARPDLINETQWALECVSIILAYYEDFFNVSYPLPKQDLVAIPDFAAGAMENWGLITYREVDLLFDPGVSATGNKQRVAVVIAHELAHQWFGNLVTMKWWNDLWLNEGFASYVEYIGTDAVRRDWKMIDHFFGDTVLYAYSVDSLVTSHPIDVSVATPDEISSLFDAISYDKGASILQMLYNFLGRETFLKGLSLYLQSHSFQNAETADLWSALQNVLEKGQLPSPLTVSSIMSTWTKQSGFPLVNCVEKSKQVTLEQRRFVYSSANASLLPPSPYKYMWSIPITFYTDKQSYSNSPQWLTSSSNSYSLSSEYNWIKLNVDQVGYYRVNYTESMWQALANQLQRDHTVFSPKDRAGLLADAFDLARAGLLNVTIGLDLTNYLSKEANYVPWRAILSKLGYVRDMLALRPSLGKLKTFLCEKLAPLLEKYLSGDIPDSHDEKLLRVSVVDFGWKIGCSLSSGASTRDLLSSHFAKFMAGNETVDPDFHSTVYGAGIAAGGEEEWEFVWKIFQNTNVASEKRACFSALAQSTQPWILNRYLEYSIDDSLIRSQDTGFVFAYVSRNVIGRSFVWNFLRNNWDNLFDRYGSESFSLGYFVRYVSSSFNTQFQLKEFDDFFNGRDAGAADRVVKQSREKIESNVKWMMTNEETVDRWLTAANLK